MWKDFFWVSFQPTRAWTLQRISRTAGQCLALLVNDGIIWKHSSQYSGLMSIYLQGVCSSLPFYLSKHIWCLVAGASNMNVCFPEDACSVWYSFYALVVPVFSVRQKSPLVTIGEISATTLVKVSHAVVLDMCVFQSQWHKQYVLNKQHFKASAPIATICLVLQTAWSPIAPTWTTPLHSLKYSFTLTSNLTAIPKGKIDCSDPREVKGYIFMLQ